tara:strand:- start:2587 stop:3357 length:771 start_codon:yes stop_codon:yes gene_type:complete
LLAACQTATPPSETVPLAVRLDQQLHSRALGFAKAMEAGDTATGMAYAAPAAQGFFEAQMELEKLQWGEEERREPAEVAVKSARRDGDHGVAIVTMTRDGQARDLALHFELDSYIWGAVGFVLEEGEEVRLFADREAKLREQLARAIEETTPHPELGPFVTAYLAAGANKDKAGMAANMTPDCQKKELRDNSFTTGFLAGRFQVKNWQFSRHEIEGDTAIQHIRTLLALPGGETDGEPMRFAFEKTASGWVITGIR